MCLLKKIPGDTDALSQLASQLANGLQAPQHPHATSEPCRGSARRRLWDLGPGAACPVTGVCLRFSEVKQLARRAGLRDPGPTEYDWHVAVVAECRRRSPLAERIQRELDERYSLSIQQSKAFKDDEALAAWWDQACQGGHWAGVFWAVLTHARCSPALEQVVLGQVHMLQHQVGMAARVDMTQFEALVQENRQLAQALSVAQQKLQAAVQEAARRQALLEAELLRCRADLIREKTAHAQTQQAWDACSTPLPSHLSVQRLVQDKQALLAANRQLRRALSASASNERTPAPAVNSAIQTSAQTDTPTPTPTPAPLHVHDKAVLCVGGRPAVVPLYRDAIEDRGGRFLHHDGGQEDKVGQLGVLLQSADLVICQVGCVSHNAYWRVKAHCKRHDKPCLFLESPSRAAIEKALQAIPPVNAAHTAEPVAPAGLPAPGQPNRC